MNRDQKYSASKKGKAREARREGAPYRRGYKNGYKAGVRAGLREAAAVQVVASAEVSS